MIIKGKYGKLILVILDLKSDSRFPKEIVLFASMKGL